MRPIWLHAASTAATRLPRRATGSPNLGWRRLCCTLLLALGVVTLTVTPTPQRAFADEWCASC